MTSWSSIKLITVKSAVQASLADTPRKADLLKVKNEIQKISSLVRNQQNLVALGWLDPYIAAKREEIKEGDLLFIPSTPGTLLSVKDAKKAGSYVTATKEAYKTFGFEPKLSPQAHKRTK